MSASLLSSKEYETIIISEMAEHVVLVTLNRPEVLNAVNRQFWLEFRDLLSGFNADDAARVLVITGAGKAFSSGADLKESKTRSAEEYRAYLELVQDVSLELLECEKPTIAALNGYALGAGLELALACDFRIAAEDSKLGFPESKVSSSATGGTFRLLYDLHGPGKAAQLLFTSEFVSGEVAVSIGLVEEVVPSEQLLAKVKEMAETIASYSSESICLQKKGLRLAREGLDLKSIMRFEVESCLQALATKDREAALDKFEKKFFIVQRKLHP